MLSAIFLDTNILIYAAAGAKSEPRKWAISAELFQHPEAAISAQVMAEFFWNVVKKKYLDVGTAARWLDTMMMMPCVEVDSSLVLDGAAIARRHQIAYWDAALIAACKRCDAETLYTEDLNHGQLYEGVRVVNPFREN
jgi:predicted nucleic acid-binding protein